MLQLHTLASGSSGNALLVSGGGSHILIDAGISCRRITTALKGLGIDPADLSAVLVTHEHSDHVSGIATLVKKLPVKVYASAGTARQLAYRIPFRPEQLMAFGAGAEFDLGPFHCASFSTPHDAADSVGYTVELEGSRLAVATDLGYVTDTVRRAVLGADTVVVESNHDVDWVNCGPYPYYLKQRILGDRGHLCNEDGALLAAQAVEAGARTVVLAHLSRENNTPARAYDVACRSLSARGIDPERDVRLVVARPDQVSPPLTVSKEAKAC